MQKYNKQINQHGCVDMINVVGNNQDFKSSKPIAKNLKNKNRLT